MDSRMRMSDGATSTFPGLGLSAGGNRRNSPKAKPAVADHTASGLNEAPEKLVDPIRVYSEKELTREFDKISNMLAPEQDWSVRMTAMQRLEGLVFGGAAEYASFSSLIKHLVGPLSAQLSDRRSSIVKQACHLLNLLSKELLADFESCAEAFIPVLFKLVVITVLVIAESADTCIKTMLRNCRVARVLPRIIDCAKNDRSSVLRARCCEYALLVLEQWGDSMEIQRTVDLYEDLIKCCVGDAISEVRSSARACYRVFAKYWPDRAHRLYLGFDGVIQRLINEEDGGIHKRYASPSVRDRGGSGHQTRQPASHPSTGGQSSSFVPTPVVAMDQNSSTVVGSSFASSGSLLHALRKPTEQLAAAVPERTLESVLQASQQQVNAIEAMLKGIEIPDNGNVPTPSHLKTKVQGGSYQKIHASVGGGRPGVDPPSARDPPHPASAPILNQGSHIASVPSYLRGVFSGMGEAGSYDVLKGNLLGSNNLSDAHSTTLAPYSAKRAPLGLDRLSQSSSNDEVNEYRPSQRVQHSNDVAHYRGDRDMHKDLVHSSIPSFQRPLMRATGSARSSGGSWSSLDETQLPFGESYNYMEGIMSLHDALSEGSSANADWSARVAAFNYLKKLLQQGPRGVQDVAQSFEKVMKLFSAHLDDPHHKVAQAALSTLVDLVPACRKPFDAYMERILPHIFARLVDPKESIRHMSTAVLDAVGNTYSIESLLPALLRSLDEQRSPKAKVAVIEFSINTFSKLALNGEGSGGGGGNLLKLWLAKLTPLANCKNPKLKETAVTGIISVYSHFDSVAVLNFILGLSIEEQSVLRRALKQYTPRIEVDLMNFLQNRTQKAKTSKAIYDQPEAQTLATDEEYGVSQGRFMTSIPKNQYVAGHASGSVNSDGGKKRSGYPSDSMQGSNKEDKHRSYFPNYEVAGPVDDSLRLLKGKEGLAKSFLEGSPDRPKSWSDQSLRAYQSTPEHRNELGSSAVAAINAPQVLEHEHPMSSLGGRQSSEMQRDIERSNAQSLPIKIMQDYTSLVPDLLNQLCSNEDKTAFKKHEALDKILELSRKNDTALWSQFHSQILTGLLEVVEKCDSSIREHALLTVAELLSNQKQVLEDYVEILLEKFLHCSNDSAATVSDAADRCINIILTQYDPNRCLMVIVPLLGSEDEKTLVKCISSLTKLVGRLPSEELMAQLPSFLPALFDAFGNQSADVRKTVVFCLVDIYIVLGKAFLPYLGSLSSTQLRLVTIYANRISQARSGTPLDVAPS